MKYCVRALRLYALPHDRLLAAMRKYGREPRQ